MPNAQPAREGLVSLRDQLAEVLASRGREALGHDAALRLVVELHELQEAVTWCREASLSLARNAEPEVTWDELQAALGRADSTLQSRLRAWRAKEGNR